MLGSLHAVLAMPNTKWIQKQILIIVGYDVKTTACDITTVNPIFDLPKLISVENFLLNLASN